MSLCRSPETGWPSKRCHGNSPVGVIIGNGRVFLPSCFTDKKNVLCAIYSMCYLNSQKSSSTNWYEQENGNLLNYLTAKSTFGTGGSRHSCGTIKTSLAPSQFSFPSCWLSFLAGSLPREGGSGLFFILSETQEKKHLCPNSVNGHPPVESW